MTETTIYTVERIPNHGHVSIKGRFHTEEDAWVYAQWCIEDHGLYEFDDAETFGERGDCVGGFRVGGTEWAVIKRPVYGSVEVSDMDVSTA